MARKKKAAANRAKRESKNVGGRWEGRGGVGCAACCSASCCCDRRVALCAPAWLPVSQLLPSLFPLLCTPQVPNLIFQIEEFERLLIRISKTGESGQHSKQNAHGCCRLLGSSRRLCLLVRCPRLPTCCKDSCVCPMPVIRRQVQPDADGAAGHQPRLPGEDSGADRGALGVLSHAEPRCALQCKKVHWALRKASRDANSTRNAA